MGDGVISDRNPGLANRLPEIRELSQRLAGWEEGDRRPRCHGNGNRLTNVQLAIPIVEGECDLLVCGGRRARRREQRCKERGNDEEWSKCA